MTTDTRTYADARPTVGPDPQGLEDAASFTVADGQELVVYLRTVERAWLQSDRFCSLEEFR